LLLFPSKGATLALDFKNDGPRTMRRLGELDDLVQAAGGRLYPAKDGRISAGVF
jgi:L-gulonolactone oxidase